MKVQLYIEGGGSSKSLHIECREGFRKLFESAGFAGRMPKTHACGSRNDAFADFKRALKNVNSDDYPVLLVDSEGPVTKPAWQHLRDRDGWPRPTGVDDEQAQLMVQCMESWCLADQQALRIFFRNCLQETALPSLHDLENRHKDDVQSDLANATRPCGSDREYRKGKRSFVLVGRLDPAQLRRCLPHFAQLCDMLTRRL